MDKNKFWLGRRLFNTASPRLGALTQRKARPQDGCPNATQGTSASWAPQRNARHVCKLGTPTHVRNANTRHAFASPQVGHHNAAQSTSASWATKRNARHIRKLGAPKRNPRHDPQAKTSTQCSTPLTQDELEDVSNKCLEARLHTFAKFGRPNATQDTSASWAPQRNTRHVRKLSANAMHVCKLSKRNARRPQVGHPSARPQHKRKARPHIRKLEAENATQGTSARWSPKRKTHPQRKRPHKGALG
jgi:hypothetical protein